MEHIRLPFVAAILEREIQIQSINRQPLEAQPGSVQERLKDIKEFVLEKLVDLSICVNGFTRTRSPYGRSFGNTSKE